MIANHRTTITMQYEGHAINVAGVQGADDGAALARCMVDGGINALIRIEGVRSAAEFAFSVSDRVVGGVKAATEIPGKPEPAEAPPEPPPAAVEPERKDRRALFGPAHLALLSAPVLLFGIFLGVLMVRIVGGVQ